MKENDCPRPAKELVINEVGLGTNVFLELTGPPLAPLHGMVIVLNELNATTRHVIPLKGGLGNDGFFLMSNDSRAGECFIISEQFMAFPASIFCWFGEPLLFFYFPQCYVIVFCLSYEPPPIRESPG